MADEIEGIMFSDVQANAEEQKLHLIDKVLGMTTSDRNIDIIRICRAIVILDDIDKL